MDLFLKNKVAIITGSSKGMGLATAEALLDEGVKVMMVARNSELLSQLENKFLKLKKDIIVFPGDVGDVSLAEKVVKKTVREWGRIDILINNASGPPMGGFLEFDDSDWLLAIQINLMSCIRFSREVSPHMKKNKWGRIISITSTLAKEPTSSMVMSSTLRAGVSAFTKSISSELAPFNISVNAVCPGGVITDRLIELLKVKSEKDNISYKKLLEQSQASIPAKRFALPNEIADVILFLVSERGGYINGVSLVVDGGLVKSY